jgi:hypothetical protein
MKSDDHFFPIGRTMSPLRFSALCLVLGAGVSCHGDAVTNSPVIPMGAIHFVNAVPDTVKMDFRVVDIASNAGWFAAAFRSSNMFYQGIEAGTRRLRVFYDTTDVTIAQTVFSDTSFAVAANQNYTFVEAGFARAGSLPARTVMILTDGATDPGAANLGLRVGHVGAGIAGGGALDVNVTRHPTDTLPTTPLVGNLSYGTVGNYVTVPADAAAADSLRVVVTAAGTRTPALVTLRLPTGVAGTSLVNPIAGARVVGSVLTVLIVPASVVGSAAPQGGAFAAPSGVVLVDRRPPNTAP